MYSSIYIALLVALAAAEDLSQGNEGTNMELSSGYTSSGAIDAKGWPNAAAYAFVGGKMTQIPPTPTYYRDVLLEPPPAESSISNKLTTASYFAGGAATALSAWYLLSLAMPSHTKKTAEQDLKEEDEVVESDEKDEKKSRRRREVRKSDEDMTMLASMVLSAVQSGECLQKSICLLGTQISGRKGKLADGLLGTLLPSSIQQSDYYKILRRSLRGELNCEKFGCNNNH